MDLKQLLIEAAEAQDEALAHNQQALLRTRTNATSSALPADSANATPETPAVPLTPTSPSAEETYSDEVPAGYNREGWEEAKAFDRHQRKPMKAPPSNS